MTVRGGEGGAGGKGGREKVLGRTRKRRVGHDFRDEAHRAVDLPGNLSHILYLLISLIDTRESTPPQNRQNLLFTIAS